MSMLCSSQAGANCRLRRQFTLLLFSPHSTAWPTRLGLHRRDCLRYTKATNPRFAKKMQALKGLAYDRKVECMASWRRAFREGKCARMRVVGRGLNLAMSEASRCALAVLLLTTAVTGGRSQTGVPPAHPQHEFFHVSL